MQTIIKLPHRRVINLNVVRLFKMNCIDLDDSSDDERKRIDFGKVISVSVPGPQMLGLAVSFEQPDPVLMGQCKADLHDAEDVSVQKSR